MIREQIFFDNANKHEKETDSFVWDTLENCSDELFTKAEMLDVNSFPKFLVDNNHTKDKFIWIADVFRKYHVVFLDKKRDTVRAVGFSAPLQLEEGKMPQSGWEGGLDKIISDYEQEISPNTLMALSASVSPDERGKGLGGSILEAYLQRAKELNLSRVIAPARPVNKDKFPNLSMAEYASMFDEKTNEHIDPWIRTHLNHGGKIVGIGKNSHIVCSDDGSWFSVNKWREWTGLSLEKDGLYDIPHGNAKLNIHDGIGEYREDCIWINYDI